MTTFDVFSYCFWWFSNANCEHLFFLYYFPDTFLIIFDTIFDDFLTRFFKKYDRTIDRKVNFQKLTFVKIDFLKLTFVKNWLLSSPMVVGSPLRSWTGENLIVPWFLNFFLKFPNFWKLWKLIFFWKLPNIRFAGRIRELSLFLVRTPTSVVSCVSRSLNIPRIIWVPKNR